MTHDKRIEHLLIGMLIGIAFMIGFFIWDISLHMKQQAVIIDIDPGEMQAMSTDSLNPDPALAWKDTVNNISHVSFNYSK